VKVIEMGAELGIYKSCVSARSTDKELLKHAQDGGIVSTLFAYALDEGIIDGAIVAASKEFAKANPSKNYAGQLELGYDRALEAHPGDRQHQG
jgi:coenzyme F420-reducing hydrogenase beta subunit